MIGVFDSGDGGILTVKHLRALAPMADIAFLADRENAPYGIKSREQIVRLAEDSIRHLASLGAGRVLIACCTASSVFSDLAEDLRSVATPIIAPTAAEAARVTESGRIAVIATEATVRSGAFSAALRGWQVTEIAAQQLVSLVEGGARDGRLTPMARSCIERVATAVKESGADTLILGCTHFPHLEGTLAELLPQIHIVSSARVAAEATVSEYSPSERGVTLYVSKKLKGL